MVAPHNRGDVIWQDGKIAAGFNISRTTIPFADVNFEVMRRLLRAADLPPDNVLDLGTGEGIVLAELMATEPILRATITDFSRPMLDAAAERLSGTSIDLKVVDGDFRATGWHPEVEANAPFDLVVSRFAIHHIPDETKRSLYEAIYKWLRPGGMFIHIEHVASASDLYHDAHDRLMVDCMVAARDDTPDFDEVMASYRQRADGPANILAPVSTQLDWLREIGFEDVDCAFKCFELAVFAARKPAMEEGVRV